MKLFALRVVASDRASWPPGYYLVWKSFDDSDHGWGPRSGDDYVTTKDLKEATFFDSALQVRSELRWMYEHNPEVELEAIELGAPKLRTDLTVKKPKHSVAAVLKKDTSHLRYDRPRDFDLKRMAQTMSDDIPDHWDAFEWDSLCDHT